ncbi:MAG TPA: hypothetical protein VE988_30460, partial [Gemmataceae bacterium]|nr:hypothetical protein [Gemmataceae bacterium]
NGKMVPVDVELSKDGQKLWLSVWFQPLAQGQTIPANILNGMLEANGKFGPCHFFVAQSKNMVLACPVDNRYLTAEDLRREINIFVNVYAQTENLWNTQKWGVQNGGR